VLVLFFSTGSLEGYVSFYTVYAENGKIDFLVEIETLSGSANVFYYLFAVTIPNYLLSNYTIGEIIVFYRYSLDNSWNLIENCRDWLAEIEAKSIEHRVGFIYNQDNRKLGLLHTFRKIVAIGNVDAMNYMLESAEWR